MTKTEALIVLATITVICLVFAREAEAQVVTTATVLCTNANWEHSEYCNYPPILVPPDENGEVYSTLTNGVPYSQTNVTNELGIRLQKMQLQAAYWYVTDKGEIHATSDLQALSIYVTL